MIERLPPRQARRSPPRPAVPDDGAARHLRDLTPTQREVCAMVGLGYTRPEIARAMGMAEPTVRNHLSEIYRQTGQVRPAGLIAWIISEHDPRMGTLLREIERRLWLMPPHFCKGKRFIHQQGVQRLVRFILIGEGEAP